MVSHSFSAVCAVYVSFRAPCSPPLPLFAPSLPTLEQLVKPFGLEAERHLLRCLFSHIDFGDAANAAKNSLQAALLTTELTVQLNKSALLTNICYAVENCFYQQKVERIYDYCIATGA